ncbi:WSC domain-containing protein [Colletotrichum spaethianum]|uniref:WSC domain-containing protein n=1 Tax=Colletotrichum spaethianum TaxID=700344 RepID=A0AA37NXV2_9PEZI|nr:WSC domain-containing protein [Colletotrichum spaethianum]GKT40448.1 WSC domain-containing protein [Colletotrichum spaethianum]
MPAIINGQWQYAGCFKDLVNNTRLLNEAFLASDDMTLDKCAAFCSTGAYNGGAFNYFGVEYSRECFCGWDVKAAQTSTSESECSSSCAGSPIGLCGAGNRLSVYNNTVPNQVPNAPQHVPRANDYKFLGCQTEGANGRALTGKFTAADTMTVETCASFCAVDGWQFMGVEYARECFCGNSTNAGSVPAPLDDCNMICAGSRVQYCGSSNRLDLYQLSPLAPSASSSTVLPASSTASGSSSIASSSSMASDPVVSSTASSTGEVSALTSSSSSASLASSSSTTAGPTATATNGYYYIGCFQDTNSGHALPGLFANNSVTPELCIDYANSKFSNSPTSTTKMPYVFLEYHHECYGGATLDFKGAAVTSLVGKQACKDYCYGSVSTFTTDGKVTTTTGTANYCGGAKMFDLYAISTPVAFPTTGGPLVTRTVN